MYFTVDREGIVRGVNRLGARHLGYSRKELEGSPVINVFYPDDRKDAENLLKNCFKNPDKVHRWELRKVKKDGSVIWVKEHIRIEYLNKGSDLAIIVCEDITEHKLAQFLLDTDKMMFELMARNATLPEILSSLCLAIEKHSNGMLCSFLILDENGKRLKHGAAPSLPEDYVKSIDGVEIGPFVGSCGTAAYTKKSVVVADIETDPLWADYKDLALKYDLRACWSTPIVNSKNKVLGTFAMYYGRERAPSPQEKRLIDAATHLARIAIEQINTQELAMRLGEILEESPNEIYIFNAETYRFLNVNKGARINLGYTKDELLNMTPYDLKPEIKPGFFEQFKPLITGEKEKMSFSTIHQRKDGSQYPVDVYLHGSSFNGKKIFVANVIDITGQNKTEKELKEKVEQLSKKNRYESIIRAVTESLHQSLDLEEVFDNAVDALNKNVEGAENVVIFMVEDNEAVMKASRGHSARYIKKLKRIPYPKGATWKTIIEGKARYVPDTDTDDALGPAGKEFGTKSYLSMPIRSEEKTIGCIHVHSPEKNTFCEEDLNLLEIVARQLGSAIKNAEQAEELKRSQENIKQRLNELSKKKRYEEIINTVTRSVHSSIELQQVLDNAVGAMASNVSGADNVSIYFIEGSDAVIQAHRGYPGWFIEKVTRIPYPKGFTWKTMTEGKLQYCPDVEKDNVIGPAGKKVGTKSYAAMPIKYEGNTIGCININSYSKNFFDKEDINLLELIVAQIEIAVNNARQAEALRESEERYRILFEQTPMGVFIFDRNLTITHTNQRHAEILQSSIKKIIGMELRKLKDQTFTPIMEKALEGHTSRQEGWYKATTGKADINLLVSASPLRDASGKIIGGMSLIEDITERKKAEAALLESQKNYEVLVNTIDGIVWEADPETLRFTFASRQAESILGYPAEEWTKKHDFWKEKLHPEDRKRVCDFCMKATSEKRDHVIEYRMIAADGRNVWVRDLVTVVVENDEVVGLRGIIIDITDLKKAEDLIAESANKYRALVENIYDLVAEASFDGKFLYLSPSYIDALGYEPEELVGRNIFENIHPDDLNTVTEEFQRVIISRTSGKAVFKYRHKNGNWRWFDSTGRTYETAKGELRCVIVSRDITERKRLEDELFKSQKLESLGVLAGGIAHDFNNLLTVILGNISISKMKMNEQDKIYQRLMEAENASLRARDLTSQLLTFSKGGAPVKEYVQSLDEHIIDTANFAVSGSKVKCKFHIEDSLWPVEVDGGQISQVIHNLIINADQAMPNGGIISINACNLAVEESSETGIKDGKYVKISIEDKGIGMTEELMEKIFDPYFTTKHKGSGLGLATVYSIVKNHDGHIDVISEIGVGTRFDVCLPAAKNKPKENIHYPNLYAGDGNILIMDDEQAVREVAGEMITQLGYCVEYASDGAEAIEKYIKAREKGSPFDAVMIDLTVPGGMGGKEAHKILLEIDADAKVIVSSGYSNDPVMSRYDEYGFKGVVSKPYNVEELSKTLYSVINGIS